MHKEEIDRLWRRFWNNPIHGWMLVIIVVLVFFGTIFAVTPSHAEPGQVDHEAAALRGIGFDFLKGAGVIAALAFINQTVVELRIMGLKREAKKVAKQKRFVDEVRKQERKLNVERQDLHVERKLLESGIVEEVTPPRKA